MDENWEDAAEGNATPGAAAAADRAAEDAAAVAAAASKQAKCRYLHVLPWSPVVCLVSRKVLVR